MTMRQWLIVTYAVATALGSPVLATAKAQSQAGAPTPPAKLQVSAPFAQQVIVQEKGMHPEIQKLGLHAVPPGRTENVIIASNLPEKIGKISSPHDMELVASGQPRAVRIDAGGFWDTFMPLHDRAGQIIGFLVMEVPFTTASTQQGAIAKGMSIRNEVEQQVSTAASLFGPVNQ